MLCSRRGGACLHSASGGNETYVKNSKVLYFAKKRAICLKTKGLRISKMKNARVEGGEHQCLRKEFLNYDKVAHLLPFSDGEIRISWK